MWVIDDGELLSQLSLFFSKLAVVTFGGAYAVLAYMAQDVVEAFGWLKPQEMIDGLGGRNHSRAIDIGHAICGFSRRIQGCRSLDGNSGRAGHALGDIQPMLSLDFCRSALHRMADITLQGQFNPCRNFRCCCRGYPQSFALVCNSCDVCQIKYGPVRNGSGSHTGYCKR